MRSFLTALLLSFCAMASANAFKAHYGHYYATKYADNTTSDITPLCAKPGLTGINYRVRWGDVETADGTFVDTTLDSVLSTIAGMGASTGSGSTYKANNACKLWIFVEFKLFSGGPTNAAGDRQPCPTWLKAADGSPGYAANTDSASMMTIKTGATSVTNASPIVVTTSAAHGIAEGDTVFVDLVTGNTAANGQWKAKNVTATTLQLYQANGTTKSVGNGARTGSFGKVSKTPIYTCKMWDSTVRAKFNALLDHLATQYDGNANVEGFIIEESALGLNSNGATQDFTQDSAVGGTYTGTGYTSSLITIIQHCTSAFATSRCMDFLNQILSNQTGLGDISAAISAIPGNQACYSGPDLLPNSTGLYGSASGTYQYLVRHVGCRSNSAQNNSFTVPGYSMTDIFNFAVQGTFGTFPCGTGGSANCSPKQAVTKNDGLCVNSYIFWNDSTSEQAAADPVIKNNPYGSGWYGQCSCGGVAP